MTLVSTDELAALLERDHDDLVILDVRWTLIGPSMRSAYDEAHLPGAVFVDVDTDLADPPGIHGRHPLPDAAAFETAMRRAGVRSGSRVVCYDIADATSAARAWWLLRWFGHPADRVAVLDGGYAGWVATGGQVDAERPVPAPGDFRARPGGMALVDATGAASVARTGALLDARTAIRYRGEAEPVDPVAGHVPGARSAPAGDSVDGKGRFLPVDELRRRFDRLLPAGGGPVASYCGSGVTAAQQVLALELIGVHAALYADSWSGWITDPTRPVVTGESPS